MANAKSQALLLVHRIPFPPDKGDKIRSWRLFKYLAERYSLSLGCFIDDEADWAHTEQLRAMCADVCFIKLSPVKQRLKSLSGLITGEALSVPYYQNRKMHDFVKQVRARQLVVEVAFSSSMAPYLKSATCKILIDMVDVDSAKWAEYAAMKSLPTSFIYNRESKKLAGLEAELTHWADCTFLISKPEQALAMRLPGVRPERLDWWMNGVDTDYFNPAVTPALDQEAPDVVFTGAMDYWANIDAVMWFKTHVWPSLRAAKPDITFAIVGARPPAQITKLDGQDGIRVTGRVEDVRPWIGAAKISVAPLRIARGVQNKVLEAMAMARAIVASPEAATGIDAARDGVEIDLAATPDEMVGAILNLLASPQKATARGEAARACALKNYRWDAQLQRFAAHLPPGDFL